MIYSRELFGVAATETRSLASCDLSCLDSSHGTDGDMKTPDGHLALESMRTSTITRRSNFGFNLPAPIEIELESRDPSGTVDKEEEESLAPSWPAPSSPAPSSPALSWPAPSSQVTKAPAAADASGSPPVETATKDGDDAPVGDSGIPAGDDGWGIGGGQDGLSLSGDFQSPALMPADLPLETDFALSSGEEGAAQDHFISLESNDFNRGSHDAHKDRDTPSAELVHKEQEAFWLGKGGSMDKPHGTHGTYGDGSQEFRVYPHYIPIPATTEAATLPFVSGQPLAPLGNHGKSEGNSANSVGQADRKLQLQLAIHDLSICWRLFKGNDWVQEPAKDVNPGRRAEVDEKTKVSKQGPPPERSESLRVASAGRRDYSEESGSGEATGMKPKKAELLDALLENYRHDDAESGDMLWGRRPSRQPRVKMLNASRDSGSVGSARRTGRDTSCMVEVFLEHCSLRLDSFHPGPPPSLLSNLLLGIKNVQASDTLASSRPRKALHHWRDDALHPREYQQKMVTVHMTSRSPSDHYCPSDVPLGDEIMLKVRILPVRLSFGQHTVDFLRSFTQKATGARNVDANSGASKAKLSRVDGEKGAVSPPFVSCCDIGAFKVGDSRSDLRVRNIAATHCEGNRVPLCVRSIASTLGDSSAEIYAHV